jgi:hypothetical protein
MKSIKVREITVCEMMASNMKRPPATSTGFEITGLEITGLEITGLEIITVPFEPEVQP